MTESFQTSCPSKERNTITFEHNGFTYTMSEDEIEAAYRYQEHRYRLDDARRHLNILIFECEDPDPKCDVFKIDTHVFEKKYGITYEAASSPEMLEKYVGVFEKRFSCNGDENSQWNMAIIDAIRGG